MNSRILQAMRLGQILSDKSGKLLKAADPRDFTEEFRRAVVALQASPVDSEPLRELLKREGCVWGKGDSMQAVRDAARRDANSECVRLARNRMRFLPSDAAALKTALERQLEELKQQTGETK